MFVRNLPYRITSSIVRKQEDSCPVATEDIQVNLTNRQNAIDNVGYGPMNPAEPNVEFWDDKAERWNITPDEAKTALCGNCVFFIRTPSMLECISGGLGEGEDIELVVDAGELGYCQALDFKCASERTCNAWAAGGPITEEDEMLPNQKNKLSSNSIVSKTMTDDMAKESFRTGSFVSWNSSGGRARGKIERVERDGSIKVPDSDFTINGDEENPAALIRVWRKVTDGWEETDRLVGHKFTALSSIDDLSKMNCDHDKKMNCDHD